MKQTDNDHEHELADVGAQRIARIYAEALLNAAEKRQEAEAVLDEMSELIGEVFSKDAQFEAFLSSGIIGRDLKQRVLSLALQGRASELLVNFLQVLNLHERLGLFRPMVAAYRELHEKRSRLIRVHVASAVALSEDQRAKLRQELQKTFQQEPLIQSSVDPELLGGMVVKVGDWVYDASVRTRLEALRNQIIERSSHEIQSGRDRFSSAS